ncbi:hypothetical protein ACFPVT_03535 [Corynebacterium choanae]|uniref:Uncharacterized protein n=1 Tax=Corynebacterium choanae TaxID=1862358 RepID=A0A3G6J944_9CORY|nr:hypothetical protein [Corynebacterium choanae]AZA14645.1 hypothetical protein CCHOA_11370 [Corynebacterium choanae]
MQQRLLAQKSYDLPTSVKLTLAGSYLGSVALGDYVPAPARRWSLIGLLSCATGVVATALIVRTMETDPIVLSASEQDVTGVVDIDQQVREEAAAIFAESGLSRTSFADRLKDQFALVGEQFSWRSLLTAGSVISVSLLLGVAADRLLSYPLAKLLRKVGVTKPYTVLALLDAGVLVACADQLKLQVGRALVEEVEHPADIV